MKVGDLLKESPAWRELIGLVTDLYDAGERGEDAAMIFVAHRLIRIVMELAKSEVEAK